MGLAQVLDVDVVAYGGAIARRVVGAENLDGRTLRCGLEDEGYQVRLRVVVLPEPPARTGHVEVPEARPGQPAGFADGADEPVYGELGGAVRVGRHGRGRLLDRDLLGLPIDGGRGGEHEPPGICFPHGLQEIERPADVVTVVALGLLYGLADQGKRREVEHPVEALGECLADESGVHQIPGDQAPPFWYGLSVPFGEVIEHGCLVARFDELGGDDATDIASPAGYEDPHRPSIFPRSVSAVVSGKTSMMNAPAPVSLPARYLSLSAVRFGGEKLLWEWGAPS